MTRHVLAGAVLAVGATLTILLSTQLGAEVQGVALLGAALGGTLGLVPDRTPPMRVAGFAVGFAAAWIGYLLRALVLPDAPTGRAVAVLGVITLCLVVSVATRDRAPLWAMLLGAAAMAGAYEAVYTANPSGFLTTSPAQATAVLIAAGAGFACTALLGPVLERDRVTQPESHPEPRAIHGSATSTAPAIPAQAVAENAHFPFDTAKEV